MNKISIIIIDDHQLAREAWVSFINMDNRFEVVAESNTAEKGIELVRKFNPDLVILDINLPGISGIEATEKISELSPKTKVLGLSTHKQPDYARTMLRKGAKGYISKYATRDELMQAIMEVASGKKYICKTIKEIVAQQMFESGNEKKGLDHLSQREMEVINLIKQGKTSKEIASSLYLSIKTIEVHRYNILKKLNLKNAAALINYINKNTVS